MVTAARVGFALACAAVVALEALALARWQGWMPARAKVERIAQPVAPAAHTSNELASKPAPVTEIVARAAVTVMVTPAADVAAQKAAPAARSDTAEKRYYDDLRRRIRWVTARIGNESLSTPDFDSRMLLVKSAAHHAGLHEVGLGFEDVYGIISAETSWIPRRGASKDGTPNLGIAQFEPATARLLGMRDPNDPVESVHAAAMHMKEAALWSQERIAGLKLDARERAARLREGVSIYYNLSSRGRALWNGRNTRKLPRETQLHIINARAGAQQAELLEVQLRLRAYRSAPAEAVLSASALESRANQEQ
jgi:hypothetical protein